MGRGSINDLFITPIIAQYYINDGVFLLINRKFLGKINNLQYNRYARCWLISCTSFRTIYIYTCTVIYKFTFDYLYDPSYFFFTYVRKIKLKDGKNLVTIHAGDP